jgi:hypothetical protein
MWNDNYNQKIKISKESLPSSKCQQEGPRKTTFPSNLGLRRSGKEGQWCSDFSLNSEGNTGRCQGRRGVGELDMG